MLTSSSKLLELRDLQAYTTYEVYVDACTSAGCTSSPSITLITSSDLPHDLDAAIVRSINSTSMQLTWSDPRQPNGRILRSAACCYCICTVFVFSLLFSSVTTSSWWIKIIYITTTFVDRFQLWVRQSCPYPYADVGDSLILYCRPSDPQLVLRSLVYSASVDNLTPYTKYEVQLSVDNEAGSIQQSVSTYATTLPAGIGYLIIMLLSLLNQSINQSINKTLTKLWQNAKCTE